MNFDHVLWKHSVGDYDARIFNVSDIPASGFRSVYQFTEADAKSFEASGSYKGYKGTVHSETLFIDCDTEETSLSTERRLGELKISYDKFTTGGRGHHYHVPRIVPASHMLPSLDKQYVSREFPGADISFYHHVGLYRCVGARHHKTGLRKVKIGGAAGSMLDMTNESLTIGSRPRCVPVTGLQSWFLNETLQTFSVPIAKGGRHKEFVRIATILNNIGQPLPYAMAYLVNVNLMAEEPLQIEELERIADWAYHQRAK